MKELEKKLIIDNWFWRIFQTFFETSWRKWNVLTMEWVSNQKAVFIFPLTKEKEVIYLNEYRFWPRKYMKMFPSWWIWKSKTTKEAAERELLEETWYKSEKIIYLWNYIHNWYIVWDIDLYFWINCKKISNQQLEDIEEIEVLKSSLEDFEKMIKNNEIHCPWSELAFIKAKELTNNFKDFNI